MIPSAEREKMCIASRKREKCWRELQASICAYAAAVAPTRERISWQGENKIAGQKHQPRVELNLASCFDKLLPHQNIHVGGRRRPFTSKYLYDNFEMAMFAAGVDIRSHYCPVVSIRHVTMAITLFRLNGTPFEFYSHNVFGRAARVKRILRDREARWNRINKAEMDDYRAKKAAEGVAIGP